MEINMRELNAGDLFPVLSIIGKLEIKDELASALATSQQAGLNDEERGVQIMAGVLQGVLKNIDKVHYDLNDFLANISVNDLGNLDELSLGDYTELIIAFFKKPELGAFFKSLGSLMK